MTSRVLTATDHLNINLNVGLRDQKMIQPLNTPQLSSAKPRSGLQSISDLLPRLIAQYELQAEARRQIERDQRQRRRQRRNHADRRQSTFAWYQS